MVWRGGVGEATCIPRAARWPLTRRHGGFGGEGLEKRREFHEQLAGLLPDPTLPLMCKSPVGPDTLFTLTDKVAVLQLSMMEDRAGLMFVPLLTTHRLMLPRDVLFCQH